MNAVRPLSVVLAAVLVLSACGSREVRYKPADAPSATADNLTLTLEHFVQEKGQVRFLIALRNDGDDSVLVPLAIRQKPGEGDAFIVRADSQEYRTAAVTNKLPTGQNRWAHQLGNYSMVKNLGEAKTHGGTTVPAHGAAQIELTFAPCPGLTAKTPWTVTLSGAKRGDRTIGDLTLAAK